MTEHDTSWGIDPVPERLRVLGGLDLGLLWGNLGISLLVIVAGAILVPALSLPSALVAIAVGCLVGNLMLAVAGLIGAQARVPAMTLMRAPLGTRGSFLPTAINVVQCLGWTVFELLVIATAAAALSDELFGIGAQWLWTLVFGAAALAMGLLGPIGVVRTVLRKVAVWAMPLAIGYLTWWALCRRRPLATPGTRPVRAGSPSGRRSTSSSGSPSRGCRSRPTTRASRGRRAGRSGARGSATCIPDALLLALGAVILLTREVGDAAALPAAVAAGGIVALLTLVVLTVAETDEAFANAYSGAMSLQNLFPRAPQRLLIVATTGIGVIGALTLELTSFQSFLFLLGSFFVPLFAVLLADWLLSRAPLRAGRRLRRAGVAGRDARGLARRLRDVPVPLAHRAGVVGRPGQRLNPPAWGIGATLPSFVASLSVGVLAAAVARRDRALARSGRHPARRDRDHARLPRVLADGGLGPVDGRDGAVRRRRARALSAADARR